MSRLGAWVPQVRSGLLHDRDRAHRGADLAVADLAEHGLEARAEDGVGRAAHGHAVRLRLVEDLLRTLEVEAQRLLAPHVLARTDRLKADVDVVLRVRDVDHVLDVRVVVDDVRALRAGGAVGRDPVLLGLLRRPLLDEVGDRDDLNLRVGGDVAQVLRRDVSGADDADLRGHFFSFR
jgi:hypothetical protein